MGSNGARGEGESVTVRVSGEFIRLAEQIGKTPAWLAAVACALFVVDPPDAIIEVSAAIQDEYSRPAAEQKVS